MYTTEELAFLAKERGDTHFDGCVACEYGYSKCTCSDDYDDDDDDYQGDGLSGC